MTGQPPGRRVARAGTTTATGRPWHGLLARLGVAGRDLAESVAAADHKSIHMPLRRLLSASDTHVAAVVWVGGTGARAVALL